MPNNIDIEDRGWESMHKILDKEMPQKKDKRRFFLYWLTGGLAIILLSSVIVYNSFQTQLPISKTDTASSVSQTSNLPDQNSSSTNSNPTSTQVPDQQTAQLLESEKTTQTLANSDISSGSSSNSSLGLNSSSNSNSSSGLNSNSSANSKTETDLESNPLPSAQQTITTAELNNPEAQLANTGSTIKAKPTTAVSQTNVQLDTAVDTEITNNKNTQVAQTVTTTTLEKISPNLDQEQIKTPIIPNKQVIVQSQQANTDSPIQFDTPTTPTLNNAASKPSVAIASQANEMVQSEDNTNKVSIAQLIPTLSSFLTLPETAIVPMSLPLVPVTPPIIKPAYTLTNQWEIGLTGLYANQANGLGLEVSVGWRKERSQLVSTHIAIGAGCLNIANDANLGELADLSRTNDPAGLDGSVGPAGPAGAPGAGDAGGIEADGGAEGAASDMEFADTPDLELSPSQLSTLSRSNLSSLKYITSNVGIQLSPSQRLHVGVNLGIDYIVNTNFNQVFLEDDKFLTTQSSSTFNLTDVQLAAGNKILPFAEAGVTVKLSQRLGIKASYKYYLREIFPDLGNTWLNQFKLGVFFSL